MQLEAFMLLRQFVAVALVASAALGSGCEGGGPGATLDLGVLDGEGKEDTVGMTVPFYVRAGRSGEPGRVEFTVRTVGQLAVTTSQSHSQERLQIVAQSTSYRRRSWRGRTPFLTIPGVRTGGELTEYSLTVLNWGHQDAEGQLEIQVEQVPEPGVEVVFNEPDCDDCDDPAGQLRNSVVDAIQSARSSIDAAIYGLNDPMVIEALCHAADAGVEVRVVTDSESLDPDDSRSYYDWFFRPETGLAGCGIEIEAVHANAIMHHKFYIVDRGTDAPLLVTGSTNQTEAGFEVNHNHMLFVRGAPDVMDAFAEEFGQLWRHCASERLDDNSRCTECTPSCIENRSAEGPWGVGDAIVSVFFSPSDDALRELRGASSRRRLDAPDPACIGTDATCVCRPSGAAWMCDYCALEDDGFGLLDQANERILVSMYSATDQCFALGVGRAAARGVETLALWDRVRAGSPYERDDMLCAMEVPVLLSVWNDGSAQARNHNKLLVIDDIVFDGSMNLSASGADSNNEATLIMADGRLADEMAAYIEAEADLLRSLGATARSADECLCSDLVDNDGDGMVDEDDVDCDGALGGRIE